MKVCPKCGSSYSEQTLEFCLVDGARLNSGGAAFSGATTKSEANRKFIYPVVVSALLFGILAVSLLAFGWNRLKNSGEAAAKDAAGNQKPAEFSPSSFPASTSAKSGGETTAKCVSLESEKIQDAEIEFLPASYKVTPHSAETLREVAKSFKQLSEDCLMEIGIHTDKSGNEALNIELAQRRADAVKTELERLGIETNRITARGYGSSNPISGGASDQERRRNNRTEFKIYTK